MTIVKLVLMLVCLMSVTLEPKEAKVTPLLSRPDGLSRGRSGDHSGVSARQLGPYASHAFVYVLEGSIVMQVRGEKEVTLTPRQSFYEGPSDVHVVWRNASQTKPAKFVVFLVKDKTLPCWYRPTKIMQIRIDSAIRWRLICFAGALRFTI